jgi:hypothetical protein
MKCFDCKGQWFDVNGIARVSDKAVHVCQTNRRVVSHELTLFRVERNGGVEKTTERET